MKKLILLVLSLFLLCRIWAQDIINTKGPIVSLVRHYNAEHDFEGYSLGTFFRDLNSRTSGLLGVEKEIDFEPEQIKRWISQRLYEDKKLIPVAKLSMKQNWLLEKALEDFYKKPNEVYFVCLSETIYGVECLFSFVKITKDGKNEIISFRLDDYVLSEHINQFFGIDTKEKAGTDKAIPKQKR